MIVWSSSKKKSEELTSHIMDMAICGIPISKDKEQKLHIEHTSRNSWKSYILPALCQLNLSVIITSLVSVMECEADVLRSMQCFGELIVFITWTDNMLWHVGHYIHAISELPMYIINIASCVQTRQCWCNLLETGYTSVNWVLRNIVTTTTCLQKANSINHR